MVPHPSSDLPIDLGLTCSDLASRGESWNLKLKTKSNSLKYRMTMSILKKITPASRIVVVILQHQPPKRFFVCFVDPDAGQEV